MGTITTGIGLISGIDTATLIDNLIALESRGKFALQRRLATLQARRTALLDINARLLNLKSASSLFRLNKVFEAALASSSNESILRATATGAAQPGTFKFIVKQLVSTCQRLSRGFADSGSTPIGLTSLSFEFGNGRVSSNTDLSELNAGTGVARGTIEITDSKGTT
ncbi:MAG: flagellar cap protein FliD N-terminal domain-containing protein, partial [Myxococcota bacterium]